MVFREIFLKMKMMNIIKASIYKESHQDNDAHKYKLWLEEVLELIN